jgi:hypothetical protein
VPSSQLPYQHFLDEPLAWMPEEVYREQDAKDCETALMCLYGT